MLLQTTIKHAVNYFFTITQLPTHIKLKKYIVGF